MSSNFVQFNILKISTANDCGNPVVRQSDLKWLHQEFIDIERVRRFIPQEYVLIGVETTETLVGTSLIMEDGVGLVTSESFEELCVRISKAEESKLVRIKGVQDVSI